MQPPVFENIISAVLMYFVIMPYSYYRVSYLIVMMVVICKRVIKCALSIQYVISIWNFLATELAERGTGISISTRLIVLRVSIIGLNILVSVHDKYPIFIKASW